MTAYNAVNGIPCTVNTYLIKKCYVKIGDFKAM